MPILLPARLAHRRMRRPIRLHSSVIVFAMAARRRTTSPAPYTRSGTCRPNRSSPGFRSAARRAPTFLLFLRRHCSSLRSISPVHSAATKSDVKPKRPTADQGMRGIEPRLAANDEKHDQTAQENLEAAGSVAAAGNLAWGSGHRRSLRGPLRDGTAVRLWDNEVRELHGAPGVYVVDGAAFPTLPSKYLTLTIMANADRIGRHLALTKSVGRS